MSSTEAVQGVLDFIAGLNKTQDDGAERTINMQIIVSDEQLVKDLTE